MLDHETVKATIRNLNLIGPFVAKNARNIKFAVLDNRPHTGFLGRPCDGWPFEGKVVSETDDFFIVKDGRKNRFAAVDSAQVTYKPEIGEKVRVVPYARRGFDGYRPDELNADNRMIIGGDNATLPVDHDAIQSEHLQTLIRQLETLPALDGHRKITHMLIDAGAKTDSIELFDRDVNPGLAFTVSTEKHRGKVIITYLPTDFYAIDLEKNGRIVDGHHQACFDALAEVLAERIDDQQWNRITVTRI